MTLTHSYSSSFPKMEPKTAFNQVASGIFHQLCVHIP